MIKNGTANRVNFETDENIIVEIIAKGTSTMVMTTSEATIKQNAMGILHINSTPNRINNKIPGSTLITLLSLPAPL